MNQLGKKLKIGLQLSKLLTNINWHTFLRYSVYLYVETLLRYTASNIGVTLKSGLHLRYLADDFRLAGRGRPGSRSAASMMLDIPRTTTSLGDSAFAVAGPRVWNSLPPAIRDPSLSPSIFGKLLKTYLFV